MTLTIYHNPRCSKSRRALEIIRETGAEPEIVLYLDETPAAPEIEEIAAALRLPVADLLRRGEVTFREAEDLPALDDGARLAQWLATNPIALQRPIVIDKDAGKAVIGRPPENVRKLLD